VKYFEHDGRRWMEGENSGRWFALNEDGTRLVIETPTSGHWCYIGETVAERFTGTLMGMLSDTRRALVWLFESDPTVEPREIHRKTREFSLSIADVPEPAVC